MDEFFWAHKLDWAKVRNQRFFLKLPFVVFLLFPPANGCINVPVLSTRLGCTVLPYSVLSWLCLEWFAPPFLIQVTLMSHSRFVPPVFPRSFPLLFLKRFAVIFLWWLVGAGSNWKGIVNNLVRWKTLHWGGVKCKMFSIQHGEDTS